MPDEPGLIDIALECTKQPRTRSVWIDSEEQFVRESSDRGVDVVAEAQPAARGSKPTIHPQFKLVFLVAALGTQFFTLLCVGITLAAGREPPPLWERVAMNCFDLAKIGFGAVVGLLGGQKLSSSRSHDGEPAH